jgi:ankyrin repeat protein
MIDVMVKAGADVNAALKSGATPLMYAARAGNPQAITLLLDRGAKVDARENGRGETALMFAAASNRTDAIKVLLSHGADASLTSTVIDIAARNNPGARGGRGGVAPAQPVAGGDERGAPVETMGGMNALLFAARQGYRDSVQALLDGGANINAVNSGDKSSALLIAAINGHFDLAKFLLDKGADPKLASTAGATPLYATINVKWALVAEYPQPETKQEKTSYLDLMRAMLDRGADPNVKIRQELWYTGYSSSRTQITSGGATPFWRAAQSSDVAAMKLLLERGADPNIAASNGQLPLHIAAGAGVQGNQEVTVYGSWMPGVKYLIEDVHVDVNARDGRGLTALHHAAGRGDSEMVLYLVSKGADVTAVGRGGETVADYANGPRQRIQPFADTVALLQMLGSRNSHKCVSC